MSLQHIIAHVDALRDDPDVPPPLRTLGVPLLCHVPDQPDEDDIAVLLASLSPARCRLLVLLQRQRS
jgi:hypothetical protein